MLIGACWPYLDQMPAPAETWELARRLRPRAVRVCSNAAGEELLAIARTLRPERIVLRCKPPKVGTDGRRYRTGDERPDLLDYREWPSEPSLRESLRLLDAEGVGLDVELPNEPDLEWDEAGADQAWQWAAAAADCAAYLSRQLVQLRRLRTEEGPAFRLVGPALSEGWPERHEAWLAAFGLLLDGCEALAVHAYVNGRPFDDPDWGGRPLAYAERWPGRPLLVTETNGNGQGDDMGAYLRWLAGAVPSVEYACLFALPGQPGTPDWWSLTADAVDAVALAFTAPVAGAAEDTPAATVGPAAGADQTGPAAQAVATDRAFDVSNWNGDLADELAVAAAEGVSGFVVRLSLESDWHRALAVAQLEQVAAAGLKLDGYLWVYWDWSPEESVERALGLAEQAGVAVGRLWLDCEDGQPGRAAVEEWLGRAVAAAGARGQTVGIYSAAWWWTAYAGDSDRFKALPLWAADYDGRPELERPGFGGWTEEVGHQFAADGIDRSVFRRLPGGPGATAPVLLPIHHALAHLADVEAVPLRQRRCSRRQRRAIYRRIVTLREQLVGPRPPVVSEANP